MSNIVMVNSMEQKVVYQVLYVRDSNENDNGHYECTANDHTQKKDSEQFHVRVHGQFLYYLIV